MDVTGPNARVLAVRSADRHCIVVVVMRRMNDPILAMIRRQFRSFPLGKDTSRMSTDTYGIISLRMAQTMQVLTMAYIRTLSTLE